MSEYPQRTNPASGYGRRDFIRTLTAALGALFVPRPAQAAPTSPTARGLQLRRERGVVSWPTAADTSWLLDQHAEILSLTWNPAHSALPTKVWRGGRLYVTARPAANAEALAVQAAGVVGEALFCPPSRFARLPAAEVEAEQEYAAAQGRRFSDAWLEGE